MAAAARPVSSLKKFIHAQETIYPTVVEELAKGEKREHWMWFIFPQLYGLGRSQMSQLFGIKNLHEAEQYLWHGLLGQRLRDCVTLVMLHQEMPIGRIFPSPDDIKFRSCLTLFELVDEPHGIFSTALEVFYGGRRCEETLALLKQNQQTSP